MTKNLNKFDGGPAFPSPAIPDATDYRAQQRDGMSLRDYFAAKALCGMLASAEFVVENWSEGAVAAYLAADAMLAERAKKAGAA